MSDEGTVTRPMIETLLARLNSLEANISEMVNSAVQKAINASTAQLESQINESRVNSKPRSNHCD
jgi:LPS O-antigen subunit length determinant protein (WzzB/FepE family)